MCEQSTKESYHQRVTRLWRENDYITLLAEIEENPNLLFDLEFSERDCYFYLIQMLETSDCMPYFFARSLCELLDRVTIPKPLSKRWCYKRLLRVDSLISAVLDKDIERLSYVFEKLGPKTWNKYFWFIEDDYPLYSFVSDEEMLDFLIATHRKKELVLLKKIPRAREQTQFISGDNLNLVSLALCFASPTYLLKFLAYPEIHANIRRYCLEATTVRYGCIDVDITARARKVFLEDEKRRLEFLPNDNSFLGITRRILAMDQK